jgi:hypothetical protein
VQLRGLAATTQRETTLQADHLKQGLGR